MYANFDFFNIQPQTFKKPLSCYPVAMMNGNERSEVDKGGKIILPTSALDILTRLHIEYPMLFKLTSKNRTSHCGVLEFVAEEGRCYMPYWMMKNLLIKEGDVVTVEYVKMPVATFAKFQPQSVDFLEISNPKAVLENSLRNFATLTKGDVISINYNEKNYELCILETRPKDAVSIIECDMDVDFAPPVGYEEPNFKKEATNKTNSRTARNQQVKEKPPVNEGYRLDGKSTKKSTSSTSGATASANDSATTNKSSKANNDDEKQTRGIPDLNYKFGYLRLNQFINQEEEENELQKEKNAVLSQGIKLRDIGVVSKK